ncbi:hypothetical protein CLOSTHATH_00885 [Hungatella hathewayi DSM 13479]|uniref:Uncharacterized protein n=1 Tax=Hungatella hathewayi DSM 13479 TaxID=566550 RepID=D3ABB1_9FIRM|nr:hypothetical protein CLOSTHATH_00885 [Hungatella hathewayi DSM 13479]
MLISVFFMMFFSFRLSRFPYFFHHIIKVREKTYLRLSSSFGILGFSSFSLFSPYFQPILC